jgi:phosphinothricin acetyltransferase
MNANPVFIPCTSADYEAIAQIYNEYIRQGGQTMEERLHTATDIAGWVKDFNSRERLLVLKQNGKVLGWGIIKKYSPRAGYRFTCETAIYLCPDEIRKGHGSFMKKRLIDICRGLGYRHLVAKIFASNTASIAYNQKIGYEIVGTQRHIGFKNGKWVDVVIMQYIIPSPEAVPQPGLQ